MFPFDIEDEEDEELMETDSETGEADRENTDWKRGCEAVGNDSPWY